MAPHLHDSHDLPLYIQYAINWKNSPCIGKPMAKVLRWIEYIDEGICLSGSIMSCATVFYMDEYLLY